ncbi:hypothetical protein OkiPb01586_34810 [Escherichia coli]|nr:hypothetical protein [Escherichia coli]QCH67072.1 hypothetical protein CCU04_013865 [Escherichia coli O103:H2]QCH88683.1 hypothetical protein CCU02_016340 [Escherichia coli O45:H2]EFO0189345.1 hypothetical protein [Escherichia coli]EFO1676093.1 hypothetical protein [Escherichia coli]
MLTLFIQLLKYKFWRIMKLKHVGMIVVSVLAMSSAAVSAAEGDESVTTTVNLLCSKVFLLKENQHLLQTH